MGISPGKFGSHLGLIALALGIVLFPLVISNPYYLNVVNIIGLNVIIVVGLNLLIGYAGQISLGHAAFFGLGAYISGVLTVSYAVHPWLAMAIAVAATGAVAFLIGIPTLKLHGHYLVMATLGFNLIVNIMMIQWDSVTGGPSGFPGIPNLSLGSLVFDSDGKMYYLIWMVALASIALSLNLVNSRVGRGLRALHGSEIAAAAMGVRTDKYKINIFVLSTVFASLAGSLYAHYLTFISPKTFDIFFSVELVTMVIVGGMGSIWGSLLGTAFLTSLPNLLHAFDEYKDIFYGLILVLILMFVPEGAAVAIRQRWFAGKKEKRRPEGEKPRRESIGPSQPLTVGPCFTSGQESEANRQEPKAILKIEKAGVTFGGLLALADVSFDVAEGSVTALIGPNGAGKTTLINAVSGVCKLRRGNISFNGGSLNSVPSWKMAGMGLTRTFQNVQAFENMTVLENVMVGVHSRTRSELISSMFHLPGFSAEERDIQDRAWECLEFFRLQDKAHWPASSLSFGEQKRVEMARALAPHPRLILLDEPVAGLNMTETREIAALIQDMKARKITLLLVEHDMNLVMGISDRIVVLNYGRKIAEGSPQEIQKNQQVLTAYLGSQAVC